MPTLPKRVNFFDTEEGMELETVLHSMMLDPAFNTESTYAANTALYPDNLLSFVEKHKLYIVSHAAIDPRAYISNLRLKTRLR